MSEVIKVTCQYCLEVSEVECESFDDFEYPAVCPACHVTYCMECGVPIKEGAGLCHGCGEIVPEYMSPMVRTSSTSALYAEQNWDFRTQLWSNGDIFDQSKYELWGGIEIDTRQLRINRPGEDEREDEVLRELTEEEFERYKDRARENNE